MLELFLISIFIGMFGAVWGEILSAPGFIFDWYIKLIDPLPKYIKNPIGYCSYCMVGQIALWFYVFYADYNFIIHVFFIINTILFTDLFNKILRWRN